MFTAYTQNRHFSKNGEDGVLEEILKRLNRSNGWFVEIGTWDGRYLSNSYFLLKKGWKGIYLEEDQNKFPELNRTLSRFGESASAIHCAPWAAAEKKLDTLLLKTSLPKQFDVLSISIDSHDWWVWNSLTEYQPSIVVIDVNSQYQPGIDYVQPLGTSYVKFNPFFRTSPIHQDLKSGASFTALVQLGERKGYQLVCHLISWTGSLIFVKKELVSQLDMPQTYLENPDLLFNNNWFLQRFKTSVPSLEPSFRNFKFVLKGLVRSKLKKILFYFYNPEASTLTYRPRQKKGWLVETARFFWCFLPYGTRQKLKPGIKNWIAETKLKREQPAK